MSLFVKRQVVILAISRRGKTMSEQTQKDTATGATDETLEQTVQQQTAEQQPTDPDSAVAEDNAEQPTSESDVDGSELEQLKAKLAQAEASLTDQKEAVLRAHAESDNIRRRAERDVQSAHKFALESFVESLLPVIDSLEQGLAQPAESEEAKALKEGMELTLKIFIDTLKKKNVEQLDPVGESFNPELHEAMSMQENEEFEANAVIAVFQKGYALNGRLVRPARVVVNKGKAPSIDQKV